jgi:thioredoxin 1
VNTKLAAIVISVVVVIGGVVAVLATSKNNDQKSSLASNSQTASENAAMMKAHEAEAMKKGSAYISYADYTAKKDSYKDAHVVLYFHAPWCPTCQALDKDITANIANLPANTVLVKTDYDSSTSLKQKYGVTFQHTLVQVDANGNKIKKWSGSAELKDVVAEIQV